MTLTEVRQSIPSFQDAIEAGRLNTDEASAGYAGNWMYMGHDSSGVAQFKNINTRRYLKTGGTA
jgi:hypothetical protein